MPARCEVRKAKDEAIPQDGRLCVFRIGPTVLSVITVGMICRYDYFASIRCQADWMVGKSTRRSKFLL